MKIKQFKPHLLLVGLGSPKQEEFIYENIQTLNVPLSIGIGGMIDIISGTVKRAPKIMRILELNGCIGYSHSRKD